MLHRAQALSAALLMGFMESSAVGTIVVTIGKDFNDSLHVQWVVLAYLLAYLGFSIIFARISDIIGRKYTTVAAALIFSGASVACGCAQTLPQLIAFRGVQGLGGAGLFAMPTVMLPEITPMAHLNLMGALMGISMTVSAVCGPFVGGAVTTHASWRWVFWMNASCGGTVILVMLAICPPVGAPAPIRWRQLDIVGSLLFLSSSVLPVFALQQVGSGECEWTSAYFISCMACGCFTLLLLLLWIAFISKDGHTISPLFPARILTHRVMCCTMLASLLLGYTFFVVMVELPKRFQVVNGKSPEQAGICLLAVSAASAVGSICGVAASARSNRTFATLNVGTALVLLGVGLLFSIASSESLPARIFGFEIITGFGLGTIASASTIVIKIEADEADAAAAQGLISQSRLVGGNLGLAASTVLLNESITRGLKGMVSDDMLSNLQHTLLAAVDLPPAQQLVVRRVFAKSFQQNMLICMVVTAGALLLGLLTYQAEPPSLVCIASDPRFSVDETKAEVKQRLQSCSSGWTSATAAEPKSAARQSVFSTRTFWSGVPETPFFVDQFVHTYAHPSVLEWGDVRWSRTSVPDPRRFTAPATPYSARMR
ncbi:hypothetical protein KEM52_006698 [Ascosphaera acerosa]|nr:hypothetical protein KEM52_006698 [Ascosphaera acerosa]